MVITKVYSATTAGTSAVFSPYMRFDEDGIVQINHTTAGLTVNIQGRLSPDCSWVNIVLNAGGLVNSTSSGYFLIPLFPEMRVNVTGSSGVVDVYIGD